MAENMGDFAASFKGFMDSMVAQTASTKSGLADRLSNHFGGADLSSMNIVTGNFQTLDHANLHLALEECIKSVGHTLIGLSGAEMFGSEIHLSQLIKPSTPYMEISEGPVEYSEMSLKDGQTLSCLKQGLVLLESTPPLAVLMARSSRPLSQGVTLEVMGEERSDAESFLARVRKTTAAHSVYRGSVISLAVDSQRELTAQFHRLQEVEREDIILPPGLLARPGRIDQALEVPLPDAECRRRLLELYLQGLKYELSDFKELVEKTDGVSAAFIKELVRRAALLAAEEGGELLVKQGHLTEALRELALSGLTRKLLGASGLTSS